MLGHIKDLLPAAPVDNRPLKRWGRTDTGVLLHNRYATAAPTEPGTWVEIGETVRMGDVYVGGTWVAPEQSAAYWRAWRDAELATSDWRVTRATEANEAVPEAWLTYRQALRDIPEQAGFPTAVIRPTRPQE